MKITNMKWTSLAFALLSGTVYANASCFNGTLHGRYAFTLTGQILAPAPAAGLVSGVALTQFNGDGTLTQTDHVVHNGTLPTEEWRPAIGTYSLNPDCTGWMTIIPQPANPVDNSPALKLYIVVAEDSHEIRTVVSGSPNTPPFAANITSTGVRIGDCIRDRY